MQLSLHEVVPKNLWHEVCHACVDSAAGKDLGLEYEESPTMLPTAPLIGSDAALLGLQLCQALRELHALDLVYSPRLEPGRVLLTGAGRLVLRPFGTSAIDAALRKGECMTLQSMLYMCAIPLVCGFCCAFNGS